MNNNFDYETLSNMDIEGINKLYKTKESGLIDKEVKNRLKIYGDNIATNFKKSLIWLFSVNSLLFNNLFKSIFLSCIRIFLMINF